MAEQTRAMALRILREKPAKRDQITLAYRLALGRQPTPQEAALGQEFLGKQEALPAPAGAATASDPPAVRALADYCLALINLNEFVYVD
jgi:hypothetical protein